MYKLYVLLTSILLTACAPPEHKVVLNYINAINSDSPESAHKFLSDIDRRFISPKDFAELVTEYRTRQTKPLEIDFPKEECSYWSRPSRKSHPSYSDVVVLSNSPTHLGSLKCQDKQHKSGRALEAYAVLQDHGKTDGPKIFLGIQDFLAGKHYDKISGLHGDEHLDTIIQILKEANELSRNKKRYQILLDDYLSQKEIRQSMDDYATYMTFKDLKAHTYHDNPTNHKIRRDQLLITGIYKNTGYKPVGEIEGTIHFLNTSGEPFHSHEFKEDFESLKYGVLKPGEAERFAYGLTTDLEIKNWSGEITTQLTITSFTD